MMSIGTFEFFGLLRTFPALRCADFTDPILDESAIFPAAEKFGKIEITIMIHSVNFVKYLDFKIPAISQKQFFSC